MKITIRHFAPRPTGYYRAQFGRNGGEIIVVLYLQIMGRGAKIIKYDLTRKTLGIIKLITLNHSYWHFCRRIKKSTYIRRTKNMDIKFPITKRQQAK